MEAYLNVVAANAVVALVWIALASLIPEPWRRRSQALMVAMAGGLYLVGPFGFWEYPMGLAVLGFALVGLTRYWGIGAAWLVHTAIDLLHHLAGFPIMPEVPLSSFGCVALDPLLAVWFFLGAPSVFRRWRKSESDKPNAPILHDQTPGDYAT